MNMENNAMENNEAAIGEKVRELEGFRMVLGHVQNMQSEYYKPDAQNPAENGIPEWVAAVEAAQAKVGSALLAIEKLGASVSYNSEEEKAWVEAAKERGE